MFDTGYTPSAGKIVLGTLAPPMIIEKNIETAAHCYPGRLLSKGATDYDAKVADGLANVIGWLGYEHSSVQLDGKGRPPSKSDIYLVGSKTAVLRGGGFPVLGKLAAGFIAEQGDPLFSWSQGRVVPGKLIKGTPAIRVPFVQHATEFDTGIDLVAGQMVNGAQIEVLADVASSTIDVGLLSGESGGDADGFLDGVSCAALGIPVLTTATLGALLEAGETGLVKDPGHVVGTAKSITYSTSAHAIAGNIYLAIESPGVVEVGRAAYGVNAATADSDIVVESIL